MSAGLIWHCRASKRAWHCSASSAAACSRWSSSTYDGFCRDLWCMWCMHQPGVTNALTNHKIIFCNTRVFLYSAEFLAIWTSFCLLGKDPIQDIQLQKHNFTWSSRSWFVGICMIFRNRVCLCVCVDTPNFQRGGYPIWMLTVPSHFPLFLKVAAWSSGSVSDVPTVGQRHCWLGGKASKCRFTHSWTRTMWAHCGTNTNTINPLMGKQERWRKLCKCTVCCFRITKVLKFDATHE